jgi:mannitol-1-phosphate 5-dehydrogenase
MKAVIIGPGRGGCGFAGPVLRTSGYDLVFVGRDPVVVENLACLRRYRVRLVQGGTERELTVDGARALRSEQADSVAMEIASADVVATAVGAHQLAAIAPLIAEGLRRRTSPVNVLSFENLADAGPRLRAHVAEHLACQTDLDGHGFAGALVNRAVTLRLGDPCDDAPLTFVGDLPGDFVVERQGLAAPLPRLPGMTLVDDYTAAVRAKLYIFSAGHATAAYLGHVSGHRYVHTAMRSPEIRAAVIGAMAEGRRGIAACYGERYACISGGLSAIAARFENAALRDPVSRVGRDPLRKLAGDDRLVGAARLALASGVDPANLCRTAAAALCFNGPGDASSALMRTQLERDGVERTLSAVTGLPEGDPVVRRIVAAWERLPSRALQD